MALLNFNQSTTEPIPDPIEEPLQVAVISVWSGPETCTKGYCLKNDVLTKIDPIPPKLFNEARRIDVGGLEDLRILLKKLIVGNFLTSGIGKEAVAYMEQRTKEKYPFPDGWALLPIDSDSLFEFKEPMTSPEDVIEKIRKLDPAMERVGFVVSPSASSYIRHPNGNILKGLSGLHIYAIIDNGKEIPRVIEILHKKSLAKGWGRPLVATNGVVHIRSLIDMAMKTSNQPCFEGGARLSDGLTQEREVKVFDGGVLNADSITPLTAEEETDAEDYESHIRTDPKVKRESREKLDAWCLKMEKHIASRGVSAEKRQRIIQEKAEHIRSGSNKRFDLDGDWVLFFDHLATPVLVSEVIQNPADYNDKTLADPLEPEYGQGKARFYANFNKGAEKLQIHSMAHGVDLNYFLHPVQTFHDFNNLKASGNKSVRPEKKDPSLSPTTNFVEPYPGPMADVVRAISATSFLIQPGYFTLAALIGMASCCSAAYQLEKGDRLNMYGIGVGRTMSGKEPAKKAAQEIAIAGDASVAGAASSGEAIEDSILPGRSSLFVIDEIHGMLNASENAMSPPHLRSINENLLKLFSDSDGTYIRRIKANNVGNVAHNSSRNVKNPCVSLIGFSTPDNLGDSMKPSTITGGLMGRLLFVMEDPQAEIIDKEKKLIFSEDFLQRAKYIGRSQNETAPDIIIQITPDAKLQFDNFRMQFNELRKSPDNEKLNLWGRSYEKIRRISGVLAVWDNPEKPVINLDHVIWAERFVQQSNEMILSFSNRFLSNSVIQKNAATIMESLDKILCNKRKARNGTDAYWVSKGYATHSLLMNITKLSKPEFDLAIAHLIDCNKVENEEYETTSRKGRKFKGKIYCYGDSCESDF